MLVRFWGTRGSLPVAQTAPAIRAKIARALFDAQGRRFSDEAEAAGFADGLDFATAGTYGGASSCVEIEGGLPGDDGFVVCDMGSGLREFGISAARRVRAGAAPRFHILLSHLHWDHIMGFPFFEPAFDPAARITVYSAHRDAERALRRQQEEISFPVPFDVLAAKIDFVTLDPAATLDIAGMQVSQIRQLHAHDSFGYRFDAGGKSVVYSTDSEHKLEDMALEQAFEAFFRAADLVVCDTMYSVAESVTLKADWGHSSNLVAVDLCQAAGAHRLALFHHEPTYSDEDIRRMHLETIRYEELNRQGRPPLEVLCAYDGLEVPL